MTKLFSQTEPAFLTQYSEVRDRAISAGPLLEGTPGSLALRSGTGHSYWYRVFYPTPGLRKEVLVCKDGENGKLQEMRARIEFADWMARQVPLLRRIGFQVADKLTARVLVELHNRGVFEAGMVLVGTLAYMAHMNELGAMAVSSRTLDIDVARNRPLKLAAPLSFLRAMNDTGLQFRAVPEIDHIKSSTSVKLPGVQGLRVDVLVPGEALGEIVPVPELEWAAQAIPYYQYLLEEPIRAVVLAGWQAIPVRLPLPGRMVWHKFYSSIARPDTAKKAKDFEQAIRLAAGLAETDPLAIRTALESAPRSMISRLAPIVPRMLGALADHPEAAEVIAMCLPPAAKKKTPRVS